MDGNSGIGDFGKGTLVWRWLPRYLPESYLNVLKQSKEILMIAKKKQEHDFLHYLKFEVRVRRLRGAVVI